MTDSDQKKLEAALTSVLAKSRNQEGAKNLLALLFPKAESALHTYVPTDSDANERRIKRRLSQKDFAEAYFSLGPQPDSWGQSEFEIAMNGPASESFELLREKVERAPKEKRSDIRRIFLELVDSKFSSTKQLSQEWLDTIIAVSPHLLSEKDEEPQSLFSVDNEDRLRWIIVHGLRKLPPATQIDLLKSAIATAGDLTVLSDIVRSLTRDDNPDGTGTSREGFDFGEERTAIRSLLLDRIKEKAVTSDIWNQARPEKLFWFWWSTDAASEVKAFTDKALTSSDGLRKLLEITVNKVRSSAGDYENVQKTWEKIIDLKALATRATELIEAAKDDRDVRTARRFLDALERSRSSPF